MKSIGFVPLHVRRPSVQPPRWVLPYGVVTDTEDLAKRTVFFLRQLENCFASQYGNRIPFNELVYLPYNAHVVGTEWIAILLKGVQWGATS